MITFHQIRTFTIGSNSTGPCHEHLCTSSELTCRDSREHRVVRMDQGFFRSCPSIAIRTQATAGMSWACLSRTVALALDLPGRDATGSWHHGNRPPTTPGLRPAARSHEPRATSPSTYLRFRSGGRGVAMKFPVDLPWGGQFLAAKAFPLPRRRRRMCRRGRRTRRPTSSTIPAAERQLR